MSLQRVRHLGHGRRVWLRLASRASSRAGVAVVILSAGMLQLPSLRAQDSSCAVEVCGKQGCQRVDIARCAYPHAATRLPLPSGSTCHGIAGCSIPDGDGDGLNDAWEQQGGIDLDCDGEIGPNDLKLRTADPNRPDIFLTYDWMVLPDQGTACSTSADCNTGQACTEGVCRGHSHKPSQRAVAAVVEAFARKGIALHVDQGHAIPHSTTVTFDEVVPACTGGDAVNLYDLKRRYFDSHRTLAYHYAVFGHYNTCDSLEHCAACPFTDGQPAVFGATGRAELPGNDLIISLGAFSDFGFAPGFEQEAGLLMHELGHNLGLRHGGATDTPTFKPNYLSVVNNNFSFTGIPVAASAGSTVPRSCRTDAHCPTGAICGSSRVCTRIDYSGESLPTLDELSLDESLGIGAGTTDITAYICPDGTQSYGAASGSIDWNCNQEGPESNVASDLNADGQLSQLTGWADWPRLALEFQCTANGSANAPPPPETLSKGEPTMAGAMREHVFLARRGVRVLDLGGSAPERAVAILGEEDLNVLEIEPSSLKLAGLPPARIVLSDADGDGRPDLVLFFDRATIGDNSHGKSLRLSGWLKNSQLFDAELLP